MTSGSTRPRSTRGRSTTYTVRWKTGPRQWKEPFRIKAQAESFLAELRSAARKGEAFSLTTGRLVSWQRRRSDVSWYDFCVSYVDMKWKASSGKHRANTAWALITVMPAMLKTERGKPATDKEIRSALRKWAFNTKNREDRTEKAAKIFDWLSQHQACLGAG